MGGGLAGRAPVTPPIRLTTSHLDAHGIVRPSPADLLVEALAVEPGIVGRDVYAMMRMLASEGAGHPATWNLRLHVLMNDLDDLNDRRHFGWTPHDLVVYSSMPVHRGWFGEQRNGRRYASTVDPTAEHLAPVAYMIWERTMGIDAAQGGLKFVDRAAMGVQRGSGSYDELVTRWATEGLRPRDIDGDFVVFRRG